MTSIVRILKYVPKVNNLIINDRYIVKKTTFDNYKYNYLCWKSKCLPYLYLYFDEYSHNKKIFTLDFRITKDILKIKHLSINSDYNDKKSITYNTDTDRLKLTETEDDPKGGGVVMPSRFGNPTGISI